jgi:hypothetical protein
MPPDSSYPTSAPTAADLPQALWILLGVIVFFQVIGFFHRFVLDARLRWIQRELRRRTQSRSLDPELLEKKAETKEQKALFQEYLDEDPARRDLPKKEQFDGFRKWRDEKGLNWGK